jgi:hypothetical protein
MPAYRVYRFDTLSRRVVGIEVIYVANDEAAMSAARKILKDHDLEIWTESRRVGELQGNPPR